jgi:hypothetical protein
MSASVGHRRLYYELDMPERRIAGSRIDGRGG